MLMVVVIVLEVDETEACQMQCLENIASYRDLLTYCLTNDDEALCVKLTHNFPLIGGSGHCSGLLCKQAVLHYCHCAYHTVTKPTLQQLSTLCVLFFPGPNTSSVTAQKPVCVP